ncbi:uncharacterized protein BDZ99DRAFT_374694 [Mytilinidion resinicola]|uniref:Aerobic respiration control sensor protein arcB n=1 Tax=Mytilinidion resinicola TaxID=574789 RepID=A0A6A6Z6U5_9PEZI|nr:uncharacterized protein BDZ99DRAFT_374694 [Mytilinidion resinicola]KAF2816750.1 hypothetical protein BDZ99DRAFT_374694 [Mytilinidion resinicola]
MGPFDCTRDGCLEAASPHIDYFRAINWSKTSLGAMNQWPQHLCTIVNIVMKDVNPAMIFWGNDVVMIYNEAYIQVLGQVLGVSCMGKSARLAVSDYWGHFEPIIQHVQSTGASVMTHDLPLFLDRHSFLEETFFSFQFMPIMDERGCIAGFYEPIIETTKHKLLERRVNSLMEVGAQTAKARDIKTYWNYVLQTLTANDKDIPFALLYSVQEDDRFNDTASVSTTSTQPPKRCLLKGAIGVETGHPMAPSEIDLTDTSQLFVSQLHSVAKSRKTMLMNISVDHPELLEGIAWRGYGDPCSELIITPILPTRNSEHVLGFIILGLNPRRPYDEDYENFIGVMSRLLATSLASVVLFEEEMRQREDTIEETTKIQHLLADKLLQSQREVEIREQKFQRFAERTDVAIFICLPTGKYTYRNQRWFDMFSSAVLYEDVTQAWSAVVTPEDLKFCESVFSALITQQAAQTFEIKTKMHWTPPKVLSSQSQTQTHFVWVLCSAWPEIGPDGDVVEIVGCVTDISRQKWAERIQKIRSENALESKRQLENFIDTTSHEMRNPLSAVMQCADGIITSYSGIKQTYSPDPTTAYTRLIDTGIDAAQTIVQCAQHMKRIVDDILTISKLDAGLLVITPVPAQPETVVAHAVKMFESEARAADVEMNLVIDDSYRDLAVSWVNLDPTRLLQILINLITNSLKFTRLEPRRSISVGLAASSERPEISQDGIKYVRTKAADENSELIEDWMRGNNVFVQFSVQDSGCGLNEDEKAMLFARFSQASPKTHIHYGGSGLGLFISRKLAEMQGGAIGFDSAEKKGSTFSFYVKARRSRPPTTARRGSMAFLDSQRVSQSTTITGHDTRPGLVRQASDLPNNADANSEEPIQQPKGISQPPLQQTALVRKAPEVLHVLVVEDNIVNQRVLAKQLRNLGCIVDVANHGAEALDFLRKTVDWNWTDSAVVEDGKELSAVLMDWEMPVMNGLTAVKKIREYQQKGMLKGHVPVIACTANVRQQQISEAIDAGMDDVVSKPFRVPELLQRIRTLIESLPP